VNVSEDFSEDIESIGINKIVPTLLETALLATGMGFAAVARVTESRWVTCQAVDNISFGLSPGDELPVETTLCHEVRQFDQEIVIDDVEGDPVYRDHHCPVRYQFRSYISLPIYRADGSFFGTICAIDPEPRSLKRDAVVSMFRLFARLIGESLDTEAVLAQNRDDLKRERNLTDVQEKFIAILAHDLRNPISALSAGFRLLERDKPNPRSSQLIGLMKGSVQRMSLLIENLLDQARSRDGGAIIIEHNPETTLEAALRQILSEFQATAPERIMDIEIDIPGTVYCDSARIAQLFSNLVSNAVTHGTSNQPIVVRAVIQDDDFVLSVANSGTPIAGEQIETLFMPYERGADRPSREGLGLGLFIASEIAKGHDGTLDASSDDRMTVFTFRMPRDARVRQTG
jgi:signal transduction histidine kinase